MCDYFSSFIFFLGVFGEGKSNVLPPFIMKLIIIMIGEGGGGSV